MKLLSWNVAGRSGENLTEQRKRVVDRGAEIVALQEVTLETYARWGAELGEAGYSVVSSVDLVALPYPPPEPPRRQVHRRNFNLTASRLPIVLLGGLSFPDPEQARVAFPEKFVAAAVVLGESMIEVHNAHLPPGSSRGIIKPQAFEAIRRRVDRRAEIPQLLCGDFNTPSAEDDEGVTTWAYRRPKIESFWDAAERAILDHPRLRDVYRATRTPGSPFAASYAKDGPRRYDHIYATEHFAIAGCEYRHDWLETNLSDHAAVEAELHLG